MIHINSGVVTTDNDLCFINPMDIDKEWKNQIVVEPELIPFAVRKIFMPLSVDSRIFLGAIPKLAALNYLRLKYEKAIVPAGYADTFFEDPDRAEVKHVFELIAYDLKLPIDQVVSYGRNMSSNPYHATAAQSLTDEQLYDISVEYYNEKQSIPLVGRTGVVLLR